MEPKMPPIKITNFAITSICMLLLSFVVLSAAIDVTSTKMSPFIRAQIDKIFLKYQVIRVSATELKIFVVEKFIGPNRTHDIFESHPSYLSITYGIVLQDVLKDGGHSVLCSTNGLVGFDSELDESIIYKCKRSLSGFGDDHEMDTNLVRQHCQNHTTTFQPKSANSSILITGLLPHQPYAFDIVVEHFIGKVPIQREKMATYYVCMNDTGGIPNYNPKTEMSSFELLTDYDHSEFSYHRGQVSNVTIVKLFWRPLPKILVSSGDLSYLLVCHNDWGQQMLSVNITDHKVGHHVLSKPNELNYFCTVSSVNRNGLLRGRSPIKIPSMANIIDFSQVFKFYVFRLNDNSFLAKWTPIEDVLVKLRAFNKPSLVLHHTDAEIIGGNYTIFWCDKDSLAGCSSVNGWTTIDKTSFIIHPYHSTKDGSFGIAYRKDNFTSGIIWPKCIAKNEIDKPTKLIGSNTGQDWITLSWIFPGCESILALVQSIEIKYRPIDKFDDCSDESRKQLTKDEMDKYDNLNDYLSEIKPNQLDHSATIEGLNSSTRYLIKVRYILQHGERKSWSDPVPLDTSPDPRKREACRSSRLTITLISILALLFLAITASYKSKAWVEHYYILSFRYHEAKSGLQERLEDIWKTEEQAPDDPFEIMGVKYFKNRFSSSNNMTKAETMSMRGLNSREDDYVEISRQNDEDDEEDEDDDYMSDDYIPRCMMEGNSDQTTSNESTTDNTTDELVTRHQPSVEPDEISITSHSSYLETILYDVDSNHTPSCSNDAELT